MIQIQFFMILENVYSRYFAILNHLNDRVSYKVNIRQLFNHTKLSMSYIIQLLYDSCTTLAIAMLLITHFITL